MFRESYYRITDKFATWTLKLLGNKLLAVNIQAFAPDMSSCAKRDLHVATSHSQSLSVSAVLFPAITKIFYVFMLILFNEHAVHRSRAFTLRAAERAGDSHRAYSVI